MPECDQILRIGGIFLCKAGECVSHFGSKCQPEPLRILNGKEHVSNSLGAKFFGGIGVLCIGLGQYQVEVR